MSKKESTKKLSIKETIQKEFPTVWQQGQVAGGKTNIYDQLLGDDTPLNPSYIPYIIYYAADNKKPTKEGMLNFLVVAQFFDQYYKSDDSKKTQDGFVDYLVNTYDKPIEDLGSFNEENTSLKVIKDLIKIQKRTAQIQQNTPRQDDSKGQTIEDLIAIRDQIKEAEHKKAEEEKKAQEEKAELARKIEEEKKKSPKQKAIEKLQRPVKEADLTQMRAAEFKRMDEDQLKKSNKEEIEAKAAKLEALKAETKKAAANEANRVSPSEAQKIADEKRKAAELKRVKVEDIKIKATAVELELKKVEKELKEADKKKQKEEAAVKAAKALKASPDTLNKKLQELETKEKKAIQDIQKQQEAAPKRVEGERKRLEKEGDQKKISPFAEAIQKLDKAKVTTLCKLLDFMAPEKNGKTPLEFAKNKLSELQNASANAGNPKANKDEQKKLTDIIKLLEKEQEKSSKDLRTAIMRADVEAVTALLSKSIDLSQKDKNGKTPLEFTIDLANKKPKDIANLQKIADLIVAKMQGIDLNKNVGNKDQQPAAPAKESQSHAAQPVTPKHNQTSQSNNQPKPNKAMQQELQAVLAKRNPNNAVQSAGNEVANKETANKETTNKEAANKEANNKKSATNTAQSQAPNKPNFDEELKKVLAERKGRNMTEKLAAERKTKQEQGGDQGRS